MALPKGYGFFISGVAHCDDLPTSKTVRFWLFLFRGRNKKNQKMFFLSSIANQLVPYLSLILDKKPNGDDLDSTFHQYKIRIRIQNRS